MKKFCYLMTGMVLLGVMITGCETADEPFIEERNDLKNSPIGDDDALYKSHESTLPDYFAAQLEEYEVDTINTYEVRFTGSEHETNEEGEIISTTFNYLVSGTGETPQLDSFNLEIPECAGNLLSWTPEQSASVSEGSLKWNSSVSKVGSQEYSMTYEGNVPLGIITANTARGSIEESMDIIGPCQGVYILSGSIFIDSNSDGAKQSSESGILSSVNLLNKANNNKVNIATSAKGSYSFMVLSGDYSIFVNEDLLGDGNYKIDGEKYENPIDLNNVQQDFTDQNFGFDANSQKMVDELDKGEITVNTEPTKFWVDQVRHAGKKNSDFTVEEMNDLLTEIEESCPFQFGENKQKSALDILTRPIKTELDLFLQQLLTAELNILTGRGAYFETEENQIKEFNDALLVYAEAIACDDIVSTNTVTTKAVSSSDSNLLLSFNGTGGVN